MLQEVLLLISLTLIRVFELGVCELFLFTKKSLFMVHCFFGQLSYLKKSASAYIINSSVIFSNSLRNESGGYCRRAITIVAAILCDHPSSFR